MQNHEGKSTNGHILYKITITFLFLFFQIVDTQADFEIYVLQLNNYIIYIK